ncbi:hypothetical protein SNEBB_001437, partial [Seison nebaliae]
DDDEKLLENEPNSSTDDESMKETKEEEEGDGNGDDEEFDNCVICMCPFTVNGKHKMCSLNCGHVFGQSCILEWNKQTIGGHCTCPTCKKKSHVLDFRLIYFGKNRISDKSERDGLINQINETKEEYDRLMNDFNTLKEEKFCYTKLYEAELLKNRKAMKLDSETCGNFIRHHSTVNLCGDGSSNSKYIQFDRQRKKLLISQKLPKKDGWGIKCLDPTRPISVSLTPIGYSIIRDMKLNESFRNELLSISVDNSIYISSPVDHREKLSVDTSMFTRSASACCWSNVNENLFMVGDESGALHLYDKKNTSRPVHTLSSNDNNPIIRLINGKVKDKNLFLATSFTGHINSINDLTTAATVVAYPIKQTEKELERNRYNITSTIFAENNIFVSYRAIENRPMVDQCHYQLVENSSNPSIEPYHLNGVSIKASTPKNIFITRSKASLVYPSSTASGVYAFTDETKNNFQIVSFNNLLVDHTWEFNTKTFVRDFTMLHSQSSKLEKIYALTDSDLYIYDFVHTSKWNYLVPDL